MRELEDVVVDKEVITEESRLVLHVAEETTDERRHCLLAELATLMMGTYSG